MKAIKETYNIRTVNADELLKLLGINPKKEELTYINMDLESYNESTTKRFMRVELKTKVKK